MKTGLIIIVGYLLGSVPFSYIIARLVKGVDIRKYGSGNIGAANVFLTIGPMAGILAGILDAGKGIMAILIAKQFILDECGIVFTGLASIVGHNWPVYLGFVGGKGVATSFGILTCLVPRELFIALGAWVLIVSLSRYITLGGIIAGLFLPILVWYFGRPKLFIISSAVIICLLGIKTFSSIKDLFNGKECKIGERREEPSLS